VKIGRVKSRARARGNEVTVPVVTLLCWWIGFEESTKL
jgi:hypothetical protein